MLAVGVALPDPDPGAGDADADLDDDLLTAPCVPFALSPLATFVFPPAIQFSVVVALRFLLDLAAARVVRRCSSSTSWTSRGGLIGAMDVGRVGSNIVPQFGHETNPSSAETTGLASSGFKSFCSSLDTALIPNPLVSFGMIPRMEESLNTHPQGLRAIKGTFPDISLSESGQTKGDRVGMLDVVEADGEE